MLCKESIILLQNVQTMDQPFGKKSTNNGSIILLLNVMWYIKRDNIVKTIELQTALTLYIISNIKL